MIAYFDTSALVKLLVPERGSSCADEAWGSARAVVASTLLYVEARAALAAAQRRDRLTPVATGAAVARLHDLIAQVELVPATTDLVWRAGPLADVHGLRGYDAVHLASALASGADAVVTADEELAAAATVNGLAVVVPA